jgi:hypothetical protein
MCKLEDFPRSSCSAASARDFSACVGRAAAVPSSTFPPKVSAPPTALFFAGLSRNDANRLEQVRVNRAGLNAADERIRELPLSRRKGTCRAELSFDSLLPCRRPCRKLRADALRLSGGTDDPPDIRPLGRPHRAVAGQRAHVARRRSVVSLGEPSALLTKVPSARAACRYPTAAARAAQSPGQSASRR